MAASNEITVALGGKLPKGDANGLSGLGYRLTHDVAARKQVRAAIILFDISEVNEKTDDGALVAKARVRRIEVIQDGEDFTIMQRILMREFERRTGQTTLPFDMEQDIDQLLRLVADREQSSPDISWVHRPAWESGEPEPDDGAEPEDPPEKEDQ